MPGISSRVRGDANLLNLREIPVADIRPKLTMFLIPGGNVTQAFQTTRDQVVSTNKWPTVADVQGIAGRKVSHTPYPYPKIQYFSVKTAGLLDIDSELLLAFSNGAYLQLDFTSNVDIKRIYANISHIVLQLDDSFYNAEHIFALERRITDMKVDRNVHVHELITDAE